MQEILILHFCDRCIQADGTKVEATEQVEVTIARQTARLDLCAQCVETFLRPVRDLVRAREGVQRALDNSLARSCPAASRSPPIAPGASAARPWKSASAAPTPATATTAPNRRISPGIWTMPRRPGSARAGCRSRAGAAVACTAAVPATGSPRGKRSPPRARESQRSTC